MDSWALRLKHFLWIILPLCLHLTGSSLAIPAGSPASTLSSRTSSTSFGPPTGSVFPTNPISSSATATDLNSIKTNIPASGVSSGLPSVSGSSSPISSHPSVPSSVLSTHPDLTNSVPLNPGSTSFQTSIPTSGISPGVSSNSGSTNTGSSSYQTSISTNNSPVNTVSTIPTLPGYPFQSSSGSSTTISQLPKPSSSITPFTNSPASTGSSGSGPTGSTSNSTDSLKPRDETGFTYWIIILICVVCIGAVLLMLCLGYLLWYCLRQGNTSPVCFPVYETHNIPQTYQSSCQ